MVESNGILGRPRLRTLLWPEGLDFREQLVTAAGMVGVAICWISAVANAAQGSNIETVLLNVAAGFATIGLLWFARTTGRYRLTYVITVVALFLILYPWFFFAGGGYFSGMPAFFVFAIVFSAFILDKVALWVLLPLEIAVFVACIAVAYFRPDLVLALPSPLMVMTDVVYCVVASGLALTAALRLLIRIYESIKVQLVSQNAELAQVDQAKSELLAMVAHELNTPLTVIRTHAEEATRNLHGSADGHAQATHDLGVIASETDRLGQLVAQLLDLSRIKDGSLILNTGPENLGGIVQETMRAYGPLWTQGGNSLQLERGSATPVVLIDRERIVQVLVNLLTNAARHTHDGQITVAVKVVGGFAQVQVSDTGEGIAPELLAQLGRRPLQGRRDGVRSARDAGLGVGLMISKHIVAAHGGELVLESRQGAGATVRFTVPLAAG
jgi:signal transduction histidine kinase